MTGHLFFIYLIVRFLSRREYDEFCSFVYCLSFGSPINSVSHDPISQILYFLYAHSVTFCIENHSKFRHNVNGPFFFMLSILINLMNLTSFSLCNFYITQ